MEEFGIKCKPLGEKKTETSLVQPTDDSRKSKEKYTPFFESIKEPKSFCNKHGHANVSKKENRGLANFFCSLRHASQQPEKLKLTLTKSHINDLYEAS